MDLLQKKGLVIFILALLCLLTAVYSLHAILTPFLIGGLIAYLLDPAVHYLNAKGVKRNLAVVLIFLFFAIVITLVALLIVPLLVGQLVNFVIELPGYLHWLHSSISTLLSRYFDISIQSIDIERIKAVVRNNWQGAGEIASDFIIRASSSALELVVTITNYVLVPVVAFYLLRDWDNITQSIKDFIPKRYATKVLTLLGECDEVLSSFIRGQLIVMLLLGVIYSIGLAIIGVDLALFLGMLAGLASVVPYLGAFVGIISASVAAFMQFQDVLPIVYVLMVFMAGQGIESFLLTPLLVGDKIGLHPVAVIFAILAGGQLGGFTGILIALPVAAVLMVLVRHFSQEYKRSFFYSDR